MQLAKHLLLFRYLLHRFGFDDFERLRAEFAAREPGCDARGVSYHANALLGKSGAVREQELLDLDAAVRHYEERLRTRRGQPELSLKYFQYFALLFTEYFLRRLAGEPQELVAEINAFRAKQPDFGPVSAFVEADLKKIAFWMATGSGKTLLLHANIWQMQKFFPKGFDNVLLITPNEGLSRQHAEELEKSRIPCRRYTGSDADRRCADGEVLIVEITKLTADKRGKGQSIDVAEFEGSRNLVFIDEGHKGQRSEEQIWKRLREKLAEEPGSYIFEYSATFGQIITRQTGDLLDEYAKSILFDYSYRHFYADGYGKDFSVFNLDAGKNADYSGEQVQLLLTAALLGFYEQLDLYEAHSAELRPFNIERPLWVFVGSKVVGSSGTLTKTDGQNVSDVSLILRFFQKILAAPAALQTDMDCILDGRSGMTKEGTDIFQGRFEHLRGHRPTAEDVLRKVFHGVGGLETRPIKRADGEIGLRAAGADGRYFGVVNIGDVHRYGKRLEEDSAGTLRLDDDNFHASLFQHIGAGQSGINILIGSKKFVEGWSSWRVSSMGLLNMGKSEGAQIIQLFGRGVRLKGRGFSLQREGPGADYPVRALQTIAIFGLNASYMNNFLAAINRETPEYVEGDVEIRFNRSDQWTNNILAFQRADGADFKREPLRLHFREHIARRVRADLRSRVTVAAGGFNSEVAEETPEYSAAFDLSKYLPLLDVATLTENLRHYKTLRGLDNLLLDRAGVEEVIRLGGPLFQVSAHPGQFGLRAALDGTLQRTAENLLRDYLNKQYSDSEKDFLTRHLDVRPLQPEQHAALFPKAHKMVIKLPKEREHELEQWLSDIRRFYEGEGHPDVPTVHLDRHLYSPVAVWKKGERFAEVLTDPAKLNEGETKFLRDLKAYIRGEQARKFAGAEVFVLRNLSQRGIGFYLESASFFPDFVVWVVRGDHQAIYFIDPKGILHLGNFEHEKVVFCRESLPRISAALADKIAATGRSVRVDLRAFILSVTPYADIKNRWGNADATTEDFAQNHILFMDRTRDDLGYMEEMFS